MQASELLLTIANVSVAFAGFTGIVAVFGRRADGEWRRGDILRFWQMIEISLLTLIFSLVPFVFHHMGLEETTVWAASSGMLALASAIQMARAAIGTLWAFGSDPSLSLVFSGGFVLIGVIVILVLIANAYGFIFRQEAAPYVVAIFWEMCLASILFWRLLKCSGIPYRPGREM